MKNLWTVLFSFLLVSCAGRHHEVETAPMPGSITAASLTSGAEIAQALTARYLDTAANCGTATTPAFLCNGILYRGTSHSTNYDAWNPSPDSERSGGVTFSYLRKDANSSRIIGGSKKGFIFYPVLQMPADKVKAAILCAYVLEAATSVRSDSGCGEYPNLPASVPCEVQGVSTATQWVAHYQANGSSVNDQCGFGVRSELNAVAVTGFNAMLGAHALNIAQSFSKNIELRLATWPRDTPKTLPIQAFFYVDDGLAGAQYDQRQFFYKSGRYVPIIFITLPATANGTATFEYKESDQAWGQGVVEDLQRRYNDTRHDCGDGTKPAFQCSGILLRATRATEDYHFWDPVPGSTGTGFSYIRADSKFKRFFRNPAGFIFYPSLEAPAGKLSVSVLCSFPIDGYTSIRGQPGCAQSSAFPTESKPCNTQGITTAEQWYAHYLTGPENLSAYICGFDVSGSMGDEAAGAFLQSIRAMGLLGATFFDMYNELVLASWPQSIPLEVPVQAVFYSSAASLESARFFQQDFMTATDLFIPVIKITLPSVPTDEPRFEYFVSDQAALPLVAVKPEITSVVDFKGEIAHNGTTFDNTVTLIGTATANEVVEFFQDGALLGDVPVNASSVWTRRVTGLTVRSHNFQVRARYSSNPVSAVRTVNVIQSGSGVENLEAEE